MDLVVVTSVYDMVDDKEFDPDWVQVVGVEKH